MLSGAESVNMIKKINPVLIILDLMLYYTSGDRILSEIKTFSDMLVIVVSAKCLIQTKIKTLKLGADDYVTKKI